MDGKRFMALVAAFLILAALSGSIVMAAFIVDTLPWWAMAAILGLAGFGLSWLVLENKVAPLTLLSIAVVPLPAGLAGWLLFGLPGILLALVAPLIVYWMMARIWRSMINVQQNILLVLKDQDRTRLIKGAARIMPLVPTFEFILAKIPLYPMKNTFNIRDIDTRETYNIDIRLNITYALIDETYWWKVMRMPNRPSVFAEMQREMKTNMQDNVFWEKVFERLVGEEIDVILRKWIYGVQDISSVLDSTAVQESVTAGAPTPHVLKQSNNPTAVMMVERRQNLAEDAKQEIAERLHEAWGLKVESLEFLNIKLDKDYLADLRFTQNSGITRRRQELETDDIRQKLSVRADVQADAIQKAIESVGKGIHSLNEQGMAPNKEQAAEMMRVAMQEMTLILRLKGDVESRLDPSEGIN